MRYLVAILFAIVGAALAIMFLSGPVSSYVASIPRFESSDSADNFEMLSYLAVLFGGLLFGWLVGWVIAGPLLHGATRPK